MSELKPPQKIYLQDYCEDYLSEGNTTWCDDKQNDDDIEYILQSEYDAIRAENERLREGLKEIAYHAPIHKTSWDLDDQAILDIAKQALKEVKE